MVFNFLLISRPKPSLHCSYGPYWVNLRLLNNSFAIVFTVCAPLGVSHALVTANCCSRKELPATLSVWLITVLQTYCIQVSVSPRLSISLAVSIIRVSWVQHVDHKQCVRANGPRLLVQLYACRHGLNLMGKHQALLSTSRLRVWIRKGISPKDFKALSHVEQAVSSVLSENGGGRRSYPLF